MNYTADNIVAIASSSGYAGVGVVRVSGANLSQIIKGISGRDNLKPRYAHYSDLFAADGSVLDSGLLLYFVAPNSFTGEEVLEIQGHGSPIVLNMIVKRCVELGCRLAEAGEFSKRAYLNGKLDLVQAESIADLIHAESEASAKGAIKSLKGDFSKHINQINEELINLRMFVEATLDFPEEDIEFIADAKIRDKLTIVRNSIHKLFQGTKQGVLLNNGANIVIVGQPNVGKSSLLNALANEDVAIVTEIAGTTRDIVSQKIIIDGIPFNIIDTAGIRDTDDVVEKIGIERAYNALENADLCIILVDNQTGISDREIDIIKRLPNGMSKLYIHNKIDLTGIDAHIKEQDNETHVYLSAQQKLGLDNLRQKLLSMIGWNHNESDVFLARTRHLDAMKITVEHIDYAFNNWDSLEIIAEELRYAHNSLATITGEFTADDLLGEIFSRFCIGK
ncbi:MAG: tRNA uridine-5-carboxymethylaminomethyl(34) synthesis GTPase MnmE [Burkholderiales bacterium]|nr:tRNA uridine-5-carboxymethylaminomethyl(34) synthesis GTPase MnmE [Burkholderiales bacterium]